MDETTGDTQAKKWTDIVNISCKMMQFANEELAEGNMLNSKSILDSVLRNIDQNLKSTPQNHKKELETIKAKVEVQLKQIQDRLRPRKKSFAQTENIDS